ncbi:hypothetical protein HKX48_003985 [Thoreauomyces humboldtii]|nr:hypothetical protein HKX48_003985 [Thoreauomyces humboldtii]
MLPIISDATNALTHGSTFCRGPVYFEGLHVLSPCALRTFLPLAFLLYLVLWRIVEMHQARTGGYVRLSEEELGETERLLGDETFPEDQALESSTEKWTSAIKGPFSGPMLAVSVIVLAYAFEAILIATSSIWARTPENPATDETRGPFTYLTLVYLLAILPWLIHAREVVRESIAQKQTALLLPQLPSWSVKGFWILAFVLYIVEVLHMTTYLKHADVVGSQSSLTWSLAFLLSLSARLVAVTTLLAVSLAMHVRARKEPGRHVYFDIESTGTASDAQSPARHGTDDHIQIVVDGHQTDAAARQAEVARLLALVQDQPPPSKAAAASAKAAADDEHRAREREVARVRNLVEGQTPPSKSASALSKTAADKEAVSSARSAEVARALALVTDQTPPSKSAASVAAKEADEKSSSAARDAREAEVARALATVKDQTPPSKSTAPASKISSQSVTDTLSAGVTASFAAAKSAAESGKQAVQSKVAQAQEKMQKKQDKASVSTPVGQKSGTASPAAQPQSKNSKKPEDAKATEKEVKHQIPSSVVDKPAAKKSQTPDRSPKKDDTKVTSTPPPHAGSTLGHSSPPVSPEQQRKAAEALRPHPEKKAERAEQTTTKPSSAVETKEVAPTAPPVIDATAVKEHHAISFAAVASGEHTPERQDEPTGAAVPAPSKPVAPSTGTTTPPSTAGGAPPVIDAAAVQEHHAISFAAVAAGEHPQETVSAAPSAPLTRNTSTGSLDDDDEGTPGASSTAQGSQDESSTKGSVSSKKKSNKKKNRKKAKK